MADSTPHILIHGSSRAGRRAVALAVAILAGTVLAVSPQPARADGDPASDVLAAQSLFLPQDAAAPPAISRRLAALLAAGGGRSGPRVAVIASAADLGAVTALWRQPQNYARFLGQEVSLLYRGEILVVMPDGYGLARDGRIAPAADGATLASLPAPGHALVTAAVHAVERLDRAHGITLPAGAASTDTPATTTGSLWTWIVLAAGGAMIALAWAVSLRIRPPGRPRSS